MVSATVGAITFGLEWAMADILEFPVCADGDQRLDLAAMGLRICAEIDAMVEAAYPGLAATEQTAAWQATAIGVILALLEGRSPWREG